MKKLLLLFIADWLIARLERKYRADYDRVQSSIKTKDLDDEQGNR